MNNYRPLAWMAPSVIAALILVSPTAFAAEDLAGIVKSVDVDAKKIVVTPTGKEKTVNVTVNDKTEMKTEAGDKIELKSLKEGDGVGIAHKDGVALKIKVAVKPSDLTGHIKSVATNLKSFVVTETGTTTDLTVAINSDTTIVTTDGKKLELKELKKGDGVGIAHINSLASKIVVNVKPVEKDAR